MKKLLVVIILGFIAYFVWPARYAVYPAGQGPYATDVETPTRVDRLTGDVAMLTPHGGWQSIGNTRKATAFEQPVDPNANQRPSMHHNEEVRDQHQRSLQGTQEAVDAATQ